MIKAQGHLGVAIRLRQLTEQTGRMLMSHWSWRRWELGEAAAEATRAPAAVRMLRNFILVDSEGWDLRFTAILFYC